MKLAENEIIKTYSQEETAQLISEALHLKKALSVRTLANWRSLRIGPKPTKGARGIVYTAESINAFIRQKTGFSGGRAA